MADLVNLKQARKQKQREADAALAAQNRALFGQTKATKKRDAAESQRADKAHAAHKLTPFKKPE